MWILKLIMWVFEYVNRCTMIFKVVRPINKCLHSLFCSLIEIEYKLENNYFVYNGLNCVFWAIYGKDEQVALLKRTWVLFFFSIFSLISIVWTPFFSAFFSIYMIEGDCSFSLPRGCLLIIITCSYGGRHLSFSVLSNPWNEPPYY